MQGNNFTYNFKNKFVMRNFLTQFCNEKIITTILQQKYDKKRCNDNICKTNFHKKYAKQLCKDKMFKIILQHKFAVTN